MHSRASLLVYGIIRTIALSYIIIEFFVIVFSRQLIYLPCFNSFGARATDKLKVVVHFELANYFFQSSYFYLYDARFWILEIAL